MKTCNYCGTELKRKRRYTKMESHRAFESRRFCDTVCRDSAQRKHNNPVRLDDRSKKVCIQCKEKVSRIYFLYIHDYLSDTCEFCEGKNFKALARHLPARMENYNFMYW